MSRVAMLVLAVAVAFTLTGMALAQEPAPGGRVEVLKTPDVIGKTVKNASGTELGTLDDLVIDESGRVVYAALNYKEGTNRKMFALPIKAFRGATDLSHMVLDIDRAQLDKTDGFDANNWPSRPDTRLVTKGGTDAPAARTDAPRDAGTDRKLARVSSLNGLTVKNDRGEELGTIQGFAIDLPNEKVVYAALAYGGVAGVGSKYFAIPTEALKCANPTLRAKDAVFILNATKQDFETSTGFDRKTWPIKPDMRFSKAGKKE